MTPDSRLPLDGTDPAGTTEAPEADAAEQLRDTDPAVDERLPEDLPTGVDADPADVLEQHRDAAPDEDDQR